MKVPRSVDADDRFFRSVLPNDPALKVRPMFGNLAAFVNSNMFAGLYGADLFVRLPEDGRKRLMKEDGASPFAPMAGRPMKEYVVVPRSWREKPEKVRESVRESFLWAKRLPPKG